MLSGAYDFIVIKISVEIFMRMLTTAFTRIWALATTAKYAIGFIAVSLNKSVIYLDLSRRRNCYDFKSQVVCIFMFLSMCEERKRGTNKYNHIYKCLSSNGIICLDTWF